MWSGDDPVCLANLRFLAGYRRPGLISDALVDEVFAAVWPGDQVLAMISRLGDVAPPMGVRAALLRLPWLRRLSTHLRRPLTGVSRLAVTL